MLVALISDIHGNAIALEAVLRDLEAVAPDRVVCLGDVAGWGPEPGRSVELVERVRCLTVMGNSDAWLLAPEPFVNPTAEQRRNEEIDWWCRSQLEPRHLRRLSTYEPTISIELGRGSSLVCCHGSPRSFDDPIRSDTPSATLEALLPDVGAGAIAAGHTHVPMVRRHREALVLNPGSVGMPFVLQQDGRGRNPVWAEYALLRVRSGAGDLEVSLRRVPYDLEELRAATISRAMPHAEEWLADRW